MAVCSCIERKRGVKVRNWRVTRYKCNYSAFNGYKRADSDYSTVQCLSCLAVWRTKAAYVESLPKFEID